MSIKDNIEASKALEKKALEQYNSEPIEWIESIQSHGSLIAFDFKSLLITHVSINLEKVLKIDAKSILDKSIRTIFSKEDAHDILNIASHTSTKHQREHVKVIENNDNYTIDVSLFRTENSVVIELIPTGTDFKYININNNIKWALAKTHGHENIEDILNNAVQSLQKITGFDRVMAYKFLPDNSGEVISEAISGSSMSTFLGLRFPAFDIPPRARDLFLKNPIRVIRSTIEEGTKILVNNNSDNKLNFTYSLLRAVAPVHNQYLRNMEVVSSMTLPIVIDGKLWGLFAHHHNSLKELSPQETYSADILGQTINMVLEHQTRQKAQKAVNDILENGNDFVAIETNSFKLDQFWNAQAKNLSEIIPCDGIAYVIDKNIRTYGN
jgi:light-regulated signal transduction histidine kinase (bacteriophytochrome)